MPLTTSTPIDIPGDLIVALQQAKHVMVFTGAGVSAESGIPTFRDALTGLWEHFDAQDLATADAFKRDKAMVWGWYEWRRMKVLRAQPNPAHLAIAELEWRVPKLTVVTQNVDDLHERAGSTGVVHLHGSLHAPRCFACERLFALPPGIPDVPEGGSHIPPPHCLHCGGPVRPGVVWFGESLVVADIHRAWDAAEDCDLLLVIGTSGLVQPAAGIPAMAKKAGAMVALVNPQSTPLSSECHWALQGPAGKVMPALLAAAFAEDRWPG